MKRISDEIRRQRGEILEKTFVNKRIRLVVRDVMNALSFSPPQPKWRASPVNIFVKHDAVPSSPLSYDEDLAKRLWEVSEKLTS